MSSLQALRAMILSFFAYGAWRRLRNRSLAAFSLIWLLGAPVQAEALKLVALGDSLTQGYGLAEGEGFVPQLQAWLDGEGVAVEVLNAGVSGDTTAGGLARLEWSLAGGADAMIVHLGGNDLLRGIDPSVSRANLDAILQAASARSLPVLLVALPAPANYGADYQSRFDAMFPELAATYNTALFPDFMRALRAEMNDPSALERLMQPDRIHPSAEGVRQIVADIGPEVVTLLTSIQP